jgi:hypothetical protein
VVSKLMERSSTRKPAPPWLQTGQMPPGIMLAPSIPPAFQPYCSAPRPPTAAPYERLLLLSSRVANPLQLARAALPHVAVVLYDWKNWTLQVRPSGPHPHLAPTAARVWSLAHGVRRQHLCVAIRVKHVYSMQYSMPCDH